MIRMNELKIMKTNHQGDDHVDNKMTLKQFLETLSKDDLVDLAKNQGLDSPKKLKKNQLVKHLTERIPSKFVEDCQFLTPDEMKVFTGEYEEIDVNNSFKIGKEENEYEDDDFSIPDLLEDMEAGMPMDDFFDALDEVQEEMASNTPEWLSYLINHGYAFLTEDEEAPIQIPSEIYDIYIKKTKEKLVQELDYQTLQKVLFASINLYGVCSYEQLHKLYTEYIDSETPLESIRNYVTRFIEKRKKLNANKDYFYHPLLQVEDLVPLINSDIETYHLPTREEINTYSTQLFGQQAMEPHNELKDLLLTKTKIEETLTGMLIGYEDAIDEDGLDILYDYEEIEDYLPYCLKMGKDPNHFSKKLDQLSIRFTSANDKKKAYHLYLQALENTRKWPLKGALGLEGKA